MAIDFKNIVFKFVKITGGTARIDADMKEQIFNSTKPSGVYRCFVFPNNNFGGYDYEDVQNLVAIEESDMWDKTNRDTFLGFNEESNEFIINYNAWLSSKDSDLKTDGELPHPSQAGWNTTTLSTTKSSSSKFELTQTDGSKVYLSIKPYSTKSYGAAIEIHTSVSCVENNKKSILNSALFPKNDILFAKCADDNSVILVHDCVPTITVSGSNNALSRNNKNYSSSGTITSSYSNYLYGKKIFSFASTSSKDAIMPFYKCVSTQNQTSSTDIEAIHTNNFEDIISSGESLTLYVSPKQRAFSYSYDKLSSTPFNKAYSYYGTRRFIRYGSNTSLENTFAKYSDKTTEGMSCNLISLDPRKAFVYEPSERSILLNGIKFVSIKMKSLQFINPNNIQDGFIFLVRTKDSILRYKKGDPVKRMSSSTESSFVKISGTTQFGISLYDSDSNDAIKAISLSKDNVINSVGFSDVSSDALVESTSTYSQIFVTVLRV